MFLLSSEFYRHNHLLGRCRIHGESRPEDPSTLWSNLDGREVYTLDTEKLVVAQSRLSTELTEEECQLYLRRSCEGG